MSELEHLFSPFTIGSVELRNRIANLPHGTQMVRDGVPTDIYFDHLTRIASGGVGLVITGGTYVHPSSTMRKRTSIEAFNPAALERLARIVESVNGQGARMFGQILHLGREMVGAESMFAPMAPSPIRSPREPHVPHEMHPDEIAEIVDAFAQAALNLQSIGYDGIELHAGHGYLLSQFLSPAVNKREDDYGGSLAGRMRFLEEAIAALRARCSDDLVLGVRLSADEEIPGGLRVEDSVEIAERLAGLDARVDYLNVTLGLRSAYVKDSSHPDMLAVPAASRIKAASGLTVLVAQRIRDPYDANAVIAAGHADLVGLARSLLADPLWPQKAAAGRTDEIRFCLGINQECRAMDPSTLCAINPETGRSKSFAEFTPAESPKSVVVVGGGPAGLQAALQASLHGHDVQVFERSTALGGALSTAALAPNRAALGDLIDYLSRALRRRGVETNLGVEITPDDLDDLLDDGVEAIVVATGSTPVRRTTESGGEVLTVDDVLRGTHTESAPTSAVVFDDGDGFWPAYNAVERLAADGVDVTLVTTLPLIASRLPHESVAPLRRRMAEHGVRLLPNTEVLDWGGASVDVRSLLDGHADAIPADLLVWHAGRQVDDGLWRQWKSRTQLPVIAVGDALSPRRIGHAVLDGYRVPEQI